MRLTSFMLLLGSLTLVGGCFDRDNDHPAKDADPSKPSLQMQQPDATPAAQPAAGAESTPEKTGQ